MSKIESWIYHGPGIGTRLPNEEKRAILEILNDYVDRSQESGDELFVALWGVDGIGGRAVKLGALLRHWEDARRHAAELRNLLGAPVDEVNDARTTYSCSVTTTSGIEVEITARVVSNAEKEERRSLMERAG